MTANQPILVATDLSAPSRHAAARAALLAAETGARVELLHVVEASPLAELRALLGEQNPDTDRLLLDKARESLRQLAAEVGEPHGVSPGVTVVEGSVLNEICNRADAKDVGLVVIGARGANFIRHWLLGATAARLLRMLRRPVLVARQMPHEAYRSVLVPVDFSAHSDHAIRAARRVAPQARITLLHATEVPFESRMHLAGLEEERIMELRMAALHRAKERMRALVDRHESSGRIGSLVLLGEPTWRILEHQEEQDADLIVMGKHGAGAVEDFLLGSVTKHVLTEADCDVLITD
ncbi:MAG: universal stress protein [Chromatiaceae bacterium]|nr:universal stress protein [Candidatus Thioaporhodococcus sediminis]